MTSEFGAPRVKKWPFVVGDLLLIGVAIWLLKTTGWAPTGWYLAMLIACVGMGIFFAVLPYLFEFREESRRFDANEFRGTLEQIRELEKVGERVTAAAEQWERLQEQCGVTVKAAETIGQASQTQMDRLVEITQKADTRERDHLRLEVEKQRRGEREWLEVMVGIMDHVFALHRAAVRSGQAKLIKQIDGFQNACTEICRRVGLSEYVVAPGESFDPKIHKVLEGHEAPASGGVVAETLAPGFSFQGHPIRPPMVRVAMGEAPAAEATEAPEAPKDPDLFDQEPSSDQADA